MALSEFYRSKEWEKLLAVLRSDSSRSNAEGYITCEYCGKPILKKYDMIGHHIIHLTEENYLDASISLNPDNIVFVHHGCHNKIHSKGFGKYADRQVFLVHGSPLSGKTSYIRKVMSKGDLILDIDRIWQAVSGLDMYEKPNGLKAIVFKIRDEILKDIYTRNGQWQNAYIIGGYPFENERLKLLKKYNARDIHIDTDKAECLKRLSKDTERNREEWEKYIAEYWDKVDGTW